MPSNAAFTTRLLLGALALLLAQPAVSWARSSGEQVHSALFEVDSQSRRITGPAKRLPGILGLRLVSVSMDQPRYWPDEKVRVKVLMPTHRHGDVTVRWNKRDAGHEEVRATLDFSGVAVVELLDGEEKPLELGEYRVEVSAEDSDLSGSASFSVVEGTLGAVSLAHDFERITDPDDIDRKKGAWFLGNLGGSGQRWGNHLAFVNELRVANQPLEGDVKVITRCYLPGCNGIHGGPVQELDVRDGLVKATVSVRGHSGPFHLEFVTEHGTLVHQLEGSGHVEREMHAISSGVRFDHRAGLAPYEDTTPVPGRSIFVETKKGDRDPFEIASAIADGGRAELEVHSRIEGGAVYVWSPGDDGEFVHERTHQGTFTSGQRMTVDVAQPYSLVTIGGFQGGSFVEGWALVFSPTEIELELSAPEQSAPSSVVQVDLRATEGGRDAKISGILEVFDNRVASRNPKSPLTSAIGDGIRNLSRPLSSWRAPPMEEVAAEAEPSLRSRAGRALRRRSSARAPARRAAPSRGRSGPEVSIEEAENDAPVREGEKKVVFAGKVETDESGRATVDVTLPPQTGRVSLRFVAVSGFDHATIEERVDVSQDAWAELRLPNTFVPGASLSTVLTAVNESGRQARVEVRGAGMDEAFTEELSEGRNELRVPWKANGGGEIEVTVVDESGRVLDRRRRQVRDAVHQEVTYSRLALSGGGPIPLEEGERAVVYRGPGHLLGGIVGNVVTTLESWFPHAEATGAQAAVRSTLLAAVERDVISSEGFDTQLRVGLERAVRDLETVFFDESVGLVRPYPGVEVDPLWSAWVAQSLHATLGALEHAPETAADMAETVDRARRMLEAIDLAIEELELSAERLGGYDANAPGRYTIPIEVDGEVVYEAVVDDAVRRFLMKDLLPNLDLSAETVELAFANALDVFRFLRAFERAGGLQYLTESAIALWHGGDAYREELEQIFGIIARGMVTALEPGLIQGPAILGGVYGSPMALVRFLELLVLMDEGGTAAEDAKIGFRRVGPFLKHPPAPGFGQPVTGGAGLHLALPDGAITRIDRTETLSLLEGNVEPFAEAAIRIGSAEGPREPEELRMSEEAVLELTLNEDLDPLYYYAYIAVPTTTTIKRTEDILSDYTGELIYGQRSTGADRMQTIAVPFRGSRNIRLLIEGAYAGTSPGLIAVRHMSDPEQVCSIALDPVTVRPVGD